MNESERTRRTDGATQSRRTNPLPDPPVKLTVWARHHAPHLSEVSNSNPDATLQRHNLVAITDDIEAARVVALDFERTTSPDNDTTMLVLGHSVDRESTHETDPEGVTGHAARRMLIGGIPGAIVFAAIIGVGVWLMTRNAAVTAGGAIGAAFFGFYSTAVWSFVIGTGQSEAYQQSFIDPDAADAVIVALHVDDRSFIEQARHAVSSEEKVRLFELDERGQPVA
jgi:hypothetical protein